MSLAVRPSKWGWRSALPPVCAVLLLVQLTADQSLPNQQASATFRGSTDLVQVGLQVFDKSHHALRGLTADDFEVRVDDTIETIAAFAEIDSPPAHADTAAAWTRDAAPDVASNEGADRETRLWAIIMDDCSVNDVVAAAAPFMIPNAKAIARALVDNLAPGDRAALVFSWSSQNAQDFTASREKLRAAIETFRPAPRSAGCRPQSTIRSVATFLQELANPRAAIIYIGLPPTTGAELALPRIPQLTRTPFYGFNVAGMLVGPASADVRNKPMVGLMNLAAESRPRYEFLRALVDAFGGIAMPDTNEPVLELPRVFADLSVTYLLGYQPTYPLNDGRYRRLRIRVKRPGLSVEPSDRMFKTERTPDVSKPVAAWASLTNALSGILPDAGAPLRANVVPIAAGGVKGEPSVAIVLGARVPVGSTSAAQSLEILGMIFDGEGGKKISSLTWHAEVPGSTTERAYDFLSFQPLKPGRYNLRFALQDTSANVVGSVYTDVTVPDFAKEALSLSGLVISATPAPTAAPKDAIARVLPVVPTTKREFAASDRVSAFLRIFQGGKSAIAPVTVRVRVEDEQGGVVSTTNSTIDASQFGEGRSADWGAPIAIGSLQPGRYLYTVEVSAGKKVEKRDAIFKID